ncbi:hypothetical protein QWJ34_16875 [Saccharibacillus sp. CPCC 101409]|uniref:hypothetical protein n=1 Tax=Saccharibacillus sp. CPCC 101409 TaxID=3058041 RepID=UPI002670FACD|nr:hypothetical protein [Saccharibacillus sp. CPCC 101409]MDO3411442.1 hypothetical protein [Saccharibacillus sp. CPCC 101409]
MYESYIVSGRVVERRGDTVITVQGDVVSSYHLRYYAMPAGEEAADGEVLQGPTESAAEPFILPKLKKPLFSHRPGHGHKKSAFRA